MNVMIIPEDFRKDQHILQPIVMAMLASLGKVRAKVDVCRDPLLGGISQAMNAAELAQIIAARPMIDLFLLCVDRDNEVARRARIDQLELELQPLIRKSGGLFLGENAWQEAEVWVLAGHDLPPNWSWTEVRAERDPKEKYFEPLARELGMDSEDDGGRKKMSIKAARRYRRVYQLCREDIRVLHKRLSAWLSESPVPTWNDAFALAVAET